MPLSSSESLSNPLASSFQYGGIGWPWDNTLKSYWEPKSDYDVLSTSIQMIILTMLGERVMLNEFGSDFYNLVFDQLDDKLEGQLSAIVHETVVRWDPRLSVVSVKVNDYNRESNRIDVSVVYRNRTDPKTGPVGVSFSVSK